MPKLLPRTGRRIVLRRLRVSDLPRFQAYRHDPDVGRYQGWRAEPDAAAATFLAEAAGALPLVPGAWWQLGIADRTTDALLGDIGFHVAPGRTSVELGFTLARDAQARGLASDAVRTAIALVFERMPAACVVCTTDARNDRCIRLLERLAMVRIATATAVCRYEPCTEHTYALRRPRSA